MSSEQHKEVPKKPKKKFKLVLVSEAQSLDELCVIASEDLMGGFAHAGARDFGKSITIEPGTGSKVKIKIRDDGLDGDEYEA